MKKFAVYLLVWLIGLAMTAGLYAGCSDDYRVIKNAVHNSGGSGAGGREIRWFKILVMGRGGDHETVKITLPLSLVEMVLKSCPNEEFELDHDCKINIRKVWDDLKAAGPLALIEIEDHGETVKIWLE